MAGSTTQYIEANSIPEPNSGCWLWLRCTSAGYGWGRGQYAHRASYEAFKGPTAGMVRHTCDTPICVNPDHLVAGTQTDNMRDMARRGRNGARRKLDSRAARQVRYAHAVSGSLDEVAELFNIDRSTVYQIVTGKTWRHV